MEEDLALKREDKLYYTRVILEPCKPEAVDCCKLSEMFSQVKEAEQRLQTFLDSNPFIPNARIEEKDNIGNSLRGLNSKLLDITQHLDLVSDSNRLVRKIGSDNPVKDVDDFIERVTTQLPPGGELNLLLIGKTGHGKSSTGNSILGECFFETSSGMDSTTVETKPASKVVDGRLIKVIDTPGLCDTKVSVKGNIEAMSKAIQSCGKGFNAIIICLKFGTKLTTEEETAIKMLEKIFGEDVFTDFCMIVFTGKDNFETEYKDKKMTFNDWCRQQTNAEFQKLFERCKYRCVLINNKETETANLKRQMIELIATVDQTFPDGKLYTNELFNFVQKEREKLIQQYHLPKLFEDVLHHLGLILGSIEKIDTEADDNGSLYTEIQNQAKLLDEKLAQDTDSPNIKELSLLSKSLSDLISSESSNNKAKKVKEIGEKLRKSFENMKKMSDELDKTVAAEVGNNCFPGSSEILLRNGVIKHLKDLKIGDEVLVRDCRGDLYFDTVYMFGHRNPDVHAEFVVFHTDEDNDRNRVWVSARHLVFCVRSSVEMCLPATEVRVNDELLSPMDENHQHRRTQPQRRDNALSKLQLKPTRIVHISADRKRGVYAPFTKSGTIIVDGCLMSCYVDVLPHGTSHAALAPLRMLYRLSPAALAFVNGAKNNTDIFPIGKLALKWLGHA